jgi:hypothetical protein
MEVEKDYVAAASYDPQHADEIAIHEGEQVFILHEYDDGEDKHFWNAKPCPILTLTSPNSGWVLARNENSKQVGLVPKNFLASKERGVMEDENVSVLSPPQAAITATQPPQKGTVNPSF